VIFGGVVKKGGDHHVFGDREPGVPSFTHYQGCNSQKMGHVWNVGSLAVFDVDVTRILDRAGEPNATDAWSWSMWRGYGHRPIPWSLP
jgi:hypothetical protein